MIVELVQTSGACPEQYDGYIDNVCVAYFKLRHGHFRAEYKDEIVYESFDCGDGCFESSEVRDIQLSAACNAILAKHLGHNPNQNYKIRESS